MRFGSGHHSYLEKTNNKVAAKYFRMMRLDGLVLWGTKLSWAILLIILGNIIIICKPFSPHRFWNRAGGFAIQSWFWLEQGNCGEVLLLGQPAACCSQLPLDGIVLSRLFYSRLEPELQARVKYWVGKTTSSQQLVSGPSFGPTLWG